MKYVIYTLLYGIASKYFGVPAELPVYIGLLFVGSFFDFLIFMVKVKIYK